MRPSVNHLEPHTGHEDVDDVIKILVPVSEGRDRQVQGADSDAQEHTA